MQCSALCAFALLDLDHIIEYLVAAIAQIALEKRDAITPQRQRQIWWHTRDN